VSARRNDRRRARGGGGVVNTGDMLVHIDVVVRLF
jgi:hypothetical protein